MKFNLAWLKQWVDLPNEDSLTLSFSQLGFEVDAINGDVIDLAIPPNRGDCLSISGIARDLAALFASTVTKPKIANLAATLTETEAIEVKISDEKSCPRYCGRVVKLGTKVAAGRTPKFIQTQLQAADIQLINPVVDIANYVMLELGQPLHAFAKEKIGNKIIVRKATKAEDVKLLDGNEVKLRPEDLVIADENQILALAGIMGGASSAVTDDTETIFLESAQFDAVTVRLSARAHKLQTESSYRFARFVSPDLQETALARTVALLAEVYPIEPGSVVCLTSDLKPKQVTLRRVYLEQLLGISWSDHDIIAVLQSLGMQASTTKVGFDVVVPLHRSDIEYPADLVEEIARIKGYGAIPEVMPNLAISFDSVNTHYYSQHEIAKTLVNRGYSEAVNYGFISEEQLVNLKSVSDCIEVANPITQKHTHMRPSLWPGLLQNLQYNFKRQQDRAKLFEIGQIFTQDESICNKEVLAGVIWGSFANAQWGQKTRPTDFYDVKADISALIPKLQTLEFKVATHSYLQPGQTAEIFLSDKSIGIVGLLHPKVRESLELPGPIFLFELNLEPLLTTSLVEFSEISKYPHIRRDLALLVSDQVDIATIIKVVQQNLRELLVEVKVFDIYQGKGIESGKKSVALCLILNSVSRTLVDSEVNAAIVKLIECLQVDVGATLR